MPSLDSAEARTEIHVSDSPELARMLQSGKGGEIALTGALEDMFGGSTLILDGLRRRPRYFDGRFLTGADLTRDQDYVRQRQADIARSGGSGVISGLQVDELDLVGGQTLRIAAGHGVTPSGDLVMLATARDVPLMDLPVSRQLDVAMGLSGDPRIPLTSRSGIFVLGLRAVEFTANPIAAYPRSITGQRTIEDGDIIEATAITLVPFPDQSGAATLTEARRSLARKVFLGTPGAIPQNILPIAMVALERGAVRWIDVAMVRRELGADPGVQVSLGGRPRAQAEAHVLQYRAHLQDVLYEVLRRGVPAVFAASQHFSALPAAGQLPAAAVQPDAEGFQQVWFPPSVEADLAFVPADEIAALVEESLTLPPIDLDGPAEDLDATAVTILVPVSRATHQRFNASLPTTSTTLRADQSAGLKRPAADMLDALVLRRRKAAEAAGRDAAGKASAEAAALVTKAWHAAFDEALSKLPGRSDLPPLLWYVRRRAVAWRTNVEGIAIPIAGDDLVFSAVADEGIARLKLTTRLKTVLGKATPQASARVSALLASAPIAGSDILTAGVVADLEKIANAEIPASDAISTGPLAIDPVAVDRLRLLATRTGSATGIAGPTLLTRDLATARDLMVSRTGLSRITLAGALGRSTAVRADTELGLSEGEVLDLAGDYASPTLGQGLARAKAELGDDWPKAKDAVAIGDAGLALPLDAALQKLAPEAVSDVAAKLKEAVDSGEMAKVTELIKTIA